MAWPGAKTGDVEGRARMRDTTCATSPSLLASTTAFTRSASIPCARECRKVSWRGRGRGRVDGEARATRVVDGTRAGAEKTEEGGWGILAPAGRDRGGLGGAASAGRLPTAARCTAPTRCLLEPLLLLFPPLPHELLAAARRAFPVFTRPRGERLVG